MPKKILIITISLFAFTSSLAFGGRTFSPGILIPLIAMFSALGSLAFPGTAGVISAAVSNEAKQSIEKYTPSDLITVPQDTPMLIYNIQRIATKKITKKLQKT